LNVPPDTRGLITQYDSASLIDFKKLRDVSFSNDLSKKSTINFISDKKKRITKRLNDENNDSFETITNPKSQSILIAMNQPEEISCIVLKENLTSGQQCAKFKLKIFDKNRHLIEELKGTTIGHKRIMTFSQVEAGYIEFSIESQKAPTRIGKISIFE
jgi:alpha-L-fucosidase